MCFCFCFFQRQQKEYPKTKYCVFWKKTKLMSLHTKLMNFIAKSKSTPQDRNIIQKHPTCRKTCLSQTTSEELVKSDILIMKILFSQRKQNKLSARFLYQMTVRLNIILMPLMWKSNYIIYSR